MQTYVHTYIHSRHKGLFVGVAGMAVVHNRTCEFTREFCYYNPMLLTIISFWEIIRCYKAAADLIGRPSHVQWPCTAEHVWYSVVVDLSRLIIISIRNLILLIGFICFPTPNSITPVNL